MSRRCLLLFLIQAFSLVLSACSDLESRIDVSVPSVAGENACGELQVASGEEPPYPPGGEVDEDRLEEALREAAADAGVPLSDVDGMVERALEVLEQPTTYGLALVARLDSVGEGGRPRVPCPRFVQLVRSRVRVEDEQGTEVVDLDFAESAQRTNEWVRSGGNPTPKGWAVDKTALGRDPTYGDPGLPGVFQWWRSGHTEMVDVPGVSTPWVTSGEGDVITATWEFQTWSLAPCSSAGHIEKSPENELGGGGGTADALACETFPGQPPPALRIPVGHFAWRFTVTVTVGADAEGTTASISDVSYEWHDGGASAEYRALMTANYPGWSPP